MSAKSPQETASQSPQDPPHNDEHQARCSAFQDAVSEYLIRHRSILDVLSKFQEATARVNRAVVKAVTSCGCVQVNAGRQQLPADITYWDMKEHMATHIDGQICEQCQEVLEQEIGRNMFYLAALCDLFELDLDKVIEDEHKRIATLGVFNLT